MILDYGNKQVIYYPAAAPFSWENSLDVTIGNNIQGSKFVDPDIFYGGLVEGGVQPAEVDFRLLTVNKFIGCSPLWSEPVIVNYHTGQYIAVIGGDVILDLTKVPLTGIIHFVEQDVTTRE